LRAPLSVLEDAAMSMAMVDSVPLVGQRSQLPRQTVPALLSPQTPNSWQPSFHGHRSGPHSVAAVALTAFPFLVPQTLRRWRREGRRQTSKGYRRPARRVILRANSAVATAAAVQKVAAKHREDGSGATSINMTTQHQADKAIPASMDLGTDTVSSHGLGQVVLRLYESFNECDVDATTACFTEDVIYEDLLLGNSTIVESREDFRELIATHPVFVTKRACAVLGLQAPEVAVKVDGISEDVARMAIGVEWHVEFGGEPIALGRGLSFMRICPRTGLIRRAVDIAEAPWRAVGLVFAPFARGIRMLSRGTTSVTTLFLSPFLVGWSSAAGFILVFSDRSAMDNFRTRVDTLADLRDSLSLNPLESFESVQNFLIGFIMALK